MTYYAGTYYHAGAGNDDEIIIWSDHTRLSEQEAIREARKIARAHGLRPFIEWWDRSHGLRPCDADVVEGGKFVD